MNPRNRDMMPRSNQVITNPSAVVAPATPSHQAQAHQQQQGPASNEVVMPMKRPVTHDGKPVLGQRGNTIKLKLNIQQARINPLKNEDGSTGWPTWYQYEVSIFKKLKKKEETQFTLKPVVKSMSRKVWEQLERRGLWNQQVVGVAYDGRNIAYSSAPLKLKELQNVEVVVDREGNFSITIFNQIELDPSELVKYYANLNADVYQGMVNSCLAALNIIVSHKPALQHPANRTSFYVRDTYRLTQRQGHDAFKLGNGVELWRGFFQTVRATYNDLYINLDTTTGAFVKPGNCVDFIRDFFPRGPIHLGRGSRALILINRILRTCVVELLRPEQNSNKPPRIFKMSAKGGLTFNTPANELFEVEGRMISVEDYLLATYGYRIQNRDLPCIIVKPGLLIPPELINIREGNKYLKKLDSVQQTNATQFQTLMPLERLRAIEAISGYCLQQNTLLRPFSIAVRDQHRQISGRILDPPQIGYYPGANTQGVVNVKSGAWQMMNRGRTRLVSGTQVASYVVIFPDPSRPGSGFADPEKFFRSWRTFVRACGDIGVNFARPSQERPPFIVRSHGLQVGDAVNKAIQQAETAFGRRPTLILHVFHQVNDPDYAHFKIHGVSQGVATQAIQFKKWASKSEKDFQFQVNMALKINAKLGGKNHTLVRGTTGGDAKVGPGWLDRNEAMVFGCDLTHLDGRPSLATLVASTDNNQNSYIESTTAQGLVEPSPGNEGGRARKSEIIENISNMMKDLLAAFEKKSDRLPPSQLIIYRDGASDSEWSAILTREVPMIEQGIEAFKKEAVARHPDIHLWNPKIVFLLVVKRHHIRAFNVEGSPGREVIQNIPAGTVFETGVVDARAFDFYLASHAPLLGTTRPGRYVVLRDDLGLSPDDVQSMTNSLCHVYQRCNRAVSLPAPVYYADLIAAKFRGGMPDIFGDDETVASNSTMGTPDSRRQDLYRVTSYLSSLERGLSVLRTNGSQWWL
ncbi:Piwi-domain-containing protein [Meredithblackwellia eburnea MCA 4105]